MATLTGFAPCPLLAQQVEPASFVASNKSLCYRIDVDLYTRQTDPPIQQFRTYITETKTIEVDSREERIRILDLAQSTLTICDKARQISLKVELSDLDSMMRELNAMLAKGNATLPRHSVNPLGENRISIENEVVAYDATLGQSPTPEITRRYLQFADWSTKLDAVFPPKRPPQIRLDLNAYLIEKNTVPLELKRRVKTGRSQEELTAKLLFGESPSASDSERVLKILQIATECRPVSPTKFFQ